MRRTLLLGGAAALALAACGGGGGTSDGSALNPADGPPAPVVLHGFADGSGIIRQVSATGEVTTALGARVAQVGVDPALRLDPSGLTYAGANAYGDFFAGTVTIGGTPVSVLYVQDDGGTAALAYLSGGGAVAAAAGGPAARDIPAGTYTYRGTNVVGFRSGRAVEHGTFALAVDFAAGTASLAGQTPGTAISGTGLVVDRVAGTLDGTGLALTDSVANSTRPARLHGTFHGAGGTGVAGIYTVEGDLPEVAGALAGSR